MDGPTTATGGGDVAAEPDVNAVDPNGQRAGSLTVVGTGIRTVGQLTQESIACPPGFIFGGSALKYSMLREGETLLMVFVS